MKKYLIATVLLTLASTAQAQTAGTTNDLSSNAATAALDGGKSGKDCKGKIAGRWRIYFNDPVTFCTLEIRSNGTIRKRSNAQTACRGVLLDHTAITEGRINRVAPLTNKHGSTNQCWIHGNIETKAGTLEIFEAFIAKGNASFSGVGIYLDGTATAVTGVRY